MGTRYWVLGIRFWVLGICGNKLGLDKLNGIQNKISFDLEVWKLSHQFVLNVYKISENFPQKEDYRMTAQLIRSAVSIPSNIAEGKGRNTLKDYIRFLIIARGSLEETKYYLYLAKDLQYIDESKYQELNDSSNLIGKKLNSLINSLKSKI